MNDVFIDCPCKMKICLILKNFFPLQGCRVSNTLQLYPGRHGNVIYTYNTYYCFCYEYYNYVMFIYISLSSTPDEPTVCRFGNHYNLYLVKITKYRYVNRFPIFYSEVHIFISHYWAQKYYSLMVLYTSFNSYALLYP